MRASPPPSPRTPIRTLEDLIEAHRDTSIEEHRAHAREAEERAQSRSEWRRVRDQIIVGTAIAVASAILGGAIYVLQLAHRLSIDPR